MNLITKEKLEGVNKTELVQRLIEDGHHVHPGMLRAELVNSLINNEKKINDNPIDDFRNRIMNFLQANWELVKSQLSLKCGADCYKCTDAQVLTCWLESLNVIQEYEEREK